MIEFTRLSQNATRTAAVVGDSIATVIGGPLGTFPSMTVDVITQPSGADLLSGGTAVAFAAAMTATFAVTGRYVLSVGAGDAPNLRRFEIVCFPANALTSDRIRYVEPSKVTSRSDGERRDILRALAQSATVAGITAALESGTPPAPYNGTSPKTLGANNSDNLTPFGASW